MNNTLMFSKKSDEWQTPASVFDPLHSEFGFDLDAAATADNRMVPNYLGPDHSYERSDALAGSCKWSNYGNTIWLNPPYSQCLAFIARAAMESQCGGCTVVCLVPSRTDTRWWHNYVYDRSTHKFRPGVEARFLKGRVKFGLANGQPIRESLRNGPGSAVNNSAPFPSVIIVFRLPF